MTQRQKIVAIMCREPNRWFYPYDFMAENLGQMFVGYKAPTRIAELAKDYPDMFEEKSEGRYVLRRLNLPDISEWYSKLTKELRWVISNNLSSYDQARMLNIKVREWGT